MVPKNNTEPISIHKPPINRAIPDVGVSAIPAVENAATHQYNASPYELIDAPSILRSARYTPAENNNHSTINISTIFVNGVRIEISFINLLNRVCRFVLLTFCVTHL